MGDERPVSVACAGVPGTAAGPDVAGAAVGFAHVRAAAAQRDGVERERLFDEPLVVSATDEESHDGDDEDEADEAGEAQHNASKDFVLPKGLLRRGNGRGAWADAGSSLCQRWTGNCDGAT